MLYWHFRNIQCIFSAIFRPRLTDPFQVVTRSFWANPFDSDWLSSMQAGRFFTYTDAARWEMGVRAGFLKVALKNKWVIIMGGQKIIHRRPVRIFRRFELSMQFVGWDDKWLYAAHVFRQGGDLKATSFSKLGFRGHGRLVSPREVFGQLGHADERFPPSWVMQHFARDVEILSLADTHLNR